MGMKFRNLIELQDAFPSEQSCIDYLETLRWPNGVISPFDPKSKVYKCKNNQYKCLNTNRYFNVKNGTMYENTKVGLRKWFIAIWLVTSEKKGISALSISRQISVSPKTAWLMMMKIRNCFGIQIPTRKLSGTIEVDETFVGGKNKNRHKDKKAKKCTGRAFVDKTPVLGMIERGGHLLAHVIENTSAKSIMPLINQHIEHGATVYSDEWMAYNTVHHNYKHSIVNHAGRQYKCGDVSTNAIEGFWGIFKKGMIGIYQCASKKHMQRYVDEFVFRYNTRKMQNADRFGHFMLGTNKRLTYKQLINGYTEKQRDRTC
jgi:transposase-like protein